ncbi:retrograde regulation protein 2 [Hortaea werneckii]|nr:retrograde regulation protein 2 [Hortaea werneckii]
MVNNQSEYLRAVVDMGSNGIRFSISNLQPPLTRILPTIYQHRIGISLYDAQHPPGGERRPIPDEVIFAVTSSFQRFKRTCEDFGVLDENVVVLATEATRTAPNSNEFRKRIKESTGWDVTMLSKEEEGRTGAMGVASSLPNVNGIVMDLGGGSTQLSWLFRQGESGEIVMPANGAVSMPYGAAAMSQRLQKAERNGTIQDLRKEVQSAVTEAYQHLDVPEKLQESARRLGGFTLYLSGGGFRGWGYLLMNQHRVSPYPVPVINGFKASRKEFLGTDHVRQAAATALKEDEEDVFRISERRAGQVPAVAFLVDALAEALPQIKELRFCQGGVREGHLFSLMPPPNHPQRLQTYLQQHSHQALPFANLIYYFSSHPKDLQATSALRSTTSGVLASAHGIPYEDRTLLALLLCNRWGGDVPPSDRQFKHSLEQLIDSPWTLWWINYVAAVAQLIASVFPAGINQHNKDRLKGWKEEKVDRGQRRRRSQSIGTPDFRPVRARRHLDLSYTVTPSVVSGAPRGVDSSTAEARRASSCSRSSSSAAANSASWSRSVTGASAGSLRVGGESRYLPWVSATPFFFLLLFLFLLLLACVSLFSRLITSFKLINPFLLRPLR